MVLPPTAVDAAASYSSSAQQQEVVEWDVLRSINEQPQPQLHATAVDDDDGRRRGRRRESSSASSVQQQMMLPDSPLAPPPPSVIVEGAEGGGGEERRTQQQIPTPTTPAVRLEDVYGRSSSSVGGEGNTSSSAIEGEALFNKLKQVSVWIDACLLPTYLTT